MSSLSYVWAQQDRLRLLLILLKKKKSVITLNHRTNRSCLQNAIIDQVALSVNEKYNNKEQFHSTLERPINHNKNK